MVEAHAVRGGAAKELAEGENGHGKKVGLVNVRRSRVRGLEHCSPHSRTSRRNVETPSLRRFSTAVGRPARTRPMGRFLRIRYWTTAVISDSSDLSTAWIQSMLISSPFSCSLNFCRSSVSWHRHWTSGVGGSRVSNRSMPVVNPVMRRWQSIPSSSPAAQTALPIRATRPGLPSPR